ncbi:MAG: hypothetical protein GY929_13155 [Actinomycetia bacterium]|nr:hypothetical protein [Actinomycetes bacterium]
MMVAVPMVIGSPMASTLQGAVLEVDPSGVLYWRSIGSFNESKEGIHIGLCPLDWLGEIDHGAVGGSVDRTCALCVALSRHRDAHPTWI